MRKTDSKDVPPKEYKDVCYKCEDNPSVDGGKCEECRMAGVF